MPLICEFLGIKVYIYYYDHLPPHVHLRGPGVQALVAIRDGRVISGSLPNRVETVVTSWVRQKSDALMQNWHRAQNGEPLSRVSPP
ncbi:MAG: DUF4160 domain-containing protein [Desulforudis sp.]|nr:MAG: DUF4160 domain-containing protein [Desulforudis sp.]